ncbi:SAM-dependent methyltransferase [soil metagenome]
MTELRELLAERIRAQGPVTFAEYMAEALYHPELGYYSAGPERSGWRGDFVTSAELDPAFGELWCRFFDRVWRACGQPERFELVEIGPGEGAFAHSVLSSATGGFERALGVRLIEPLPVLRARQARRLGAARVTWSASLDETPGAECGCVFANEVLDNQPVHLVQRRNGELAEGWVDADNDGLELVWRAPSTPELEAHLRRLGIELPEGHAFEVGLAAASLVRRAAKVLRRGVLVLVDYGMEGPDLLARPSGSLATYSDTGVDALVLERPGAKDITVHVDWTSVGGTLEDAGLSRLGPLPQRSVLRDLGLGDLDRRLRDSFDAASARGSGAAALRSMSRRQALAVLADPAGLGALGVMMGLKGVDASDVLLHEKEPGT